MRDLCSNNNGDSATVLAITIAAGIITMFGWSSAMAAPGISTSDEHHLAPLYSGIILCTAKKVAVEEESPDDEEKRIEFYKEKREIYTKIRKALLARNYKDIEQELNALKKKYPVVNDREYFYYSGVVAESKKIYYQAIGQYEKAVRISPGYSRAHNSLGMLWCRLNRHHRALEHLTLAVGANPYNPFINYNLGNCHYEVADYDRAITYLRASIEYKKNFGLAYQRLSMALFHIKDYVGAIEQAERAAKFSRPTALVLYFTALSHQGLGQTGAAVENLERALQLRTNFFEAAYELGNIFHRLGEYERAAGYYRRAFAINQDHQPLNNALIDCYNELGRYTDAVEMIKKLLEKDPGNEYLKKYLLNMQRKRLRENLTEPREYFGF